MMDQQALLNRIQVNNSDLLELLVTVWGLTDWLNAGHTLPDAPQSSLAHDAENTPHRPCAPIEGVEPLNVVHEDRE
jgi:hypothetical protein